MRSGVHANIVTKYELQLIHNVVIYANGINSVSFLQNVVQYSIAMPGKN